MVIYVEQYDDKSGLWNPVKLMVRRDGKDTGRRLIIDVLIKDDNDGPSFRATTDQAAKLLVAIGETL